MPKRGHTLVQEKAAEDSPEPGVLVGKAIKNARRVKAAAKGKGESGKGKARAVVPSKPSNTPADSERPGSVPTPHVEETNQADPGSTGRGEGQEGGTKCGRTAARSGGTTMKCQNKKKASAAKVLSKSEIVGLQCEIWWDGEQQFYSGEIVEYMPDKDAFKVEYADGDMDAGLSIQEYEIEMKGRRKLVRVRQSQSIDDKLYLVKPLEVDTRPQEASQQLEEPDATELQAPQAADDDARSTQKEGLKIADSAALPDVSAEADSFTEGVLQTAEPSTDGQLPSVQHSGSSEKGPRLDQVEQKAATDLKATCSEPPAGNQSCLCSAGNGIIQLQDQQALVAGSTSTSVAAEGSTAQNDRDSVEAEASRPSHLTASPTLQQSAATAASPSVAPAPQEDADESSRGQSPSAAAIKFIQPSPLGIAVGDADHHARGWAELQNGSLDANSNHRSRRNEDAQSKDSELGNPHQCGIENVCSSQSIALGAGKGLCRWAASPDLCHYRVQPGDFPLAGRLSYWPFPTLLPQADNFIEVGNSAPSQGGLPSSEAIQDVGPVTAMHFAARSHEPRIVPPPITLAPPPGARLPPKVLRQPQNGTTAPLYSRLADPLRMQLPKRNQKLADAATPISYTAHNQMEVPMLLDDPPAGLLPVDQVQLRSMLAPGGDPEGGPAVHLVPAASPPGHSSDLVAEVRQRAEAVAKQAFSERKEKLREEQATRNRDAHGRSGSKSRSQDRDRTDKRREGGANRERYDAIKRDAEARRRREQESRQQSEERGSCNAELARASCRSRERDVRASRSHRAHDDHEPSNRGVASWLRDRVDGGKRAKVVYLSDDNNRQQPGNRSPRGQYGRSGSHDRRRTDSGGHYKRHERQSRSYSRSRSRSQLPGPRESSSHSRDRRSRSRDHEKRRHSPRSCSAASTASSSGSDSSDLSSRRSSDRDSLRRLQRHPKRSDRNKWVNGSRASSVHVSRRRQPSQPQSKDRDRDQAGRKRIGLEMDLDTVRALARQKLQEGIKGSARVHVAAPDSLVPSPGRFTRGRVYVCSAAELSECITKKVIGGSRPSDVDEVGPRTAVFLYNLDASEVAGIYCGDDAADAPGRRHLESGPFKYQVAIRVWRPAASLPVSRAKDAIGAHANPHSRCPIRDHLSEKQVRSMCKEFSRGTD